MSLAPFFSYFGGKYRSAFKYPIPRYDTIAEPCAGSAGYAMRFPEKKILLVEKSEPVAAVWSYLIRATMAEIMALPLLAPGQSVDTLRVPQEAAWLIGLWMSPGSAQPKKTCSGWRFPDGRPRLFGWCKGIRWRIASQLHAIRHWRVLCADYTAAPDIEATWFVDAPYQGQGKHYPCGADEIDFAALGAWCRSRRGQVIVCEQAGATWLPFRRLGQLKSNKSNSGRASSSEAIWLNA